MACSIVAGVLGVLLLSGYLIIDGYLSRVNYDDGVLSLDTTISDDVDVPGASDTAEASVVDEGLKSRPQEKVLMDDADVYNVLLIGTDARTKSARSRSDVMMLISINKRSSKIVATSFLRDIYLVIPGVSQGNRLNTANAFGGPALLLQTVQNNFNVKVDKYIQVNFFSFIDVVDTLGGVDMKITEKERLEINKNLICPPTLIIASIPGASPWKGLTGIKPYGKCQCCKSTLIRTLPR